MMECHILLFSIQGAEILDGNTDKVGTLLNCSWNISEELIFDNMNCTEATDCSCCTDIGISLNKSASIKCQPVPSKSIFQ